MEEILKAILKFIIAFFSFLWDGLIYFIDSFPKSNEYNAKFGSTSKIASPFNEGLLISHKGKLTRKKSFENVLICGGTGSGKTSKLLIPILLNLKNCSIVINDPSKELYNKCSGYLSKFFYIKVLNFSDASKSAGYNILSRIKKSNDIQKLADLLTRTTVSGGNDPYWSIKTKETLSILVRLVLFQEKKYRTMANVLFFLNNMMANPEMIDTLIVKTHDSKLLLDYKSLIANSDKGLQNILSSTKAALQNFDDDEIAKVTSYDSIDFEELRERPTIIFLHNNVADAAYYSTLNAIVFQQFYTYILSELPKDSDLDIFILLEEASSLYVPVLPLALANCRKYRVGTVIIIQAPEQLETCYGKEASNIINNCITRIFLAGISSVNMLRELETISGKFTYQDKKGAEKTRPLITIDEARLLPENRTLILHGNIPIIKGRVSPYYKSYKYQAFCNIPPVRLQTSLTSRPIKLFTEPLQEVE